MAGKRESIPGASLVRVQTLFCPGIPGSGKTILTSIVIDKLTTEFGDSSKIGIAYLYCNFWRKDEQKAEDLVASLLKQLAQNQSSMPDSIKSLYSKHRKRRTRPSFNEISVTLQSVASTYSKVFIIVDALNELDESTQNLHSLFLSQVFLFQDKCGANIFATSRFIPDITAKFDPGISIEIRASDDNVRKYLKGQIAKITPSFVEKNEELQVHIILEISGAVGGVFLLAYIYFGSLRNKLTPKAIKNTLQQLQKKSPELTEDQNHELLASAYDQTMERINEQKEGNKTLAKRVLAWITCAKRPLTGLELQHALGVRTGSCELDQDDLTEIEDMVSKCAGLVTVEKESRIIRLVHYTAQEYFEGTQGKWFSTADSDITTACVTYLSFNAFRSGMCRTDKDLEERVKTHLFYDYAARNWGHHARKSSDVCQAVKDFVTRQSNVEASSQVLIAIKRWPGDRGYSQRVPKQMSSLHLTAFLGVYEAVQHLLQHSRRVDLYDSFSRTPLSWAAANGHEVVAKLLLEKGADIEAKDNNDGQTPLFWAAANGHEAVVKLLLEEDANIEAKDDHGQTPLSWAAVKGREGVVKLLLKEGANIEVKDGDNGGTPLLWAAVRGHKAVVKLLLEKGANIEAKDNNGQTPLSWAAERQKGRLGDAS
ncbi:hypothetical protein OQA88_12994 [Cercophora sp. LCS_1]